MPLSFRSTRAGSLYGAILVGVSAGMVWSMSGGPDSTAKNWLILAWILLTATITACWLAPKPVPRVITMTLTAVTVAIPIVAWTSGVQENVSVMPFFPLALGFLAVAVSSGKRSRPEPAESSGSPLHHG